MHTHNCNVYIHCDTGLIVQFFCEKYVHIHVAYRFAKVSIPEEGEGSVSLQVNFCNME